MKSLHDEVKELFEMSSLLSPTLPDRLRRIADGIERDELFFKSIETTVCGDVDICITFRNMSKLALAAAESDIEKRIIQRLRRNGINLK